MNQVFDHKLILSAVKQGGKIRFYYNSIKQIFRINRVPSLSHFVTRNKMRFKRVGDLLDFLFF